MHNALNEMLSGVVVGYDDDAVEATARERGGSNHDCSSSAQ